MGEYRTELVVVQPTSLCNLNCTYCYVPGRRVATRMTFEALEAVCKKVLESELVKDEIEFLWHAGEPLLAGIEFYERALNFMATYNKRGLRIRNNIQTNGTLLDSRWANFLATHGFSVGVSIDGPSFLHDMQRVRWSGTGSHAATLRGVQELRRHGIRPGALCVLTRAALQSPEELFDFFLDNDFSAVAFNVEEVENANRTTSLHPDEGNNSVVAEYTDFTRRLFDRWWPHRSKIRIREFHDLGQVFAAHRVDETYSREVFETSPLRILTIHRDGNISTFSPEFAGSVA
ncbi:uncharacterized protein SAMN05660350_04892, partial [Geodermatophilus obscurus]